MQNPLRTPTAFESFTDRKTGNPFSSLKPPSDTQKGTVSIFSLSIGRLARKSFLLIRLHPGGRRKSLSSDAPERCIEERVWPTRRDAPFEFDGGPLEVEVNVVEGMAPGVIILPKHRQLAWQKMKRWPPRVGMDQIRKTRLRRIEVRG